MQSSASALPQSTVASALATSVNSAATTPTPTPEPRISVTATPGTTSLAAEVHTSTMPSVVNTAKTVISQLVSSLNTVAEVAVTETATANQTETALASTNVPVTDVATPGSTVLPNSTTTDHPLSSSTGAASSSSSFTQNPAAMWGMAGGILAACLFMAIVFIIYRRMRKRSAAEGKVWKRPLSQIPMVEDQSPRPSWFRERFSGLFRRGSQTNISFQQEMGIIA